MRQRTLLVSRLHTQATPVGPFSPPDPVSNPGLPYDNATLLNFLFGSAEKDDSTNGRTCSTMSSPIAGTPSLTTTIDTSGCQNIIPLIAGEYSPANHGQIFGPYTSSDGVNGSKIGEQLLIPPY
jgi:hypothetical protein